MLEHVLSTWCDLKTLKPVHLNKIDPNTIISVLLSAYNICRIYTSTVPVRAAAQPRKNAGAKRTHSILEITFYTVPVRAAAEPRKNTDADALLPFFVNLAHLCVFIHMYA